VSFVLFDPGTENGRFAIRGLADTAAYAANALAVADTGMPRRAPPVSFAGEEHGQPKYGRALGFPEILALSLQPRKRWRR